MTTWEAFKAERANATTDAQRAALVGLCWYATDSNHERMLDPPGDARGYSKHYRDDWLGKRRGLFICMPTIPVDCLGYQIWCPDQPASTGGEGWKVTGEAPLITVAPSIHCVGVYHGFVQNGVLTDDCDGRKYAWANQG